MAGNNPETESDGQAAAKGVTLVSIIKTVFFAFFGVRKREAHEEQTVRLSPVQIIVAGVLGAAVFVVSLVLLAKIVVGKAMV